MPRRRSRVQIPSSAHTQKPAFLRLVFRFDPDDLLSGLQPREKVGIPFLFFYSERDWFSSSTHSAGHSVAFTSLSPHSRIKGKCFCAISNPDLLSFFERRPFLFFQFSATMAILFIGMGICNLRKSYSAAKLWSAQCRHY